MPTDLLDLARRQGGVFTTRQAARTGVTRKVTQRYLDDHIWWSLTRGLYSLSPDPTWDGLAWGGVLLGGPGAALARAAAGHKLGLCPAPDIIDVVCPRERRDRGPWRFHRAGRIDARGEPAVADVESTALSLCADAELADLFNHLARAVTSRRTSPERLLRRAKSTQNLRHRGLICEALADVASGMHSALERRFIQDVMHRHGLPEVELQAELEPSRYRDVVFHEQRLVVELDGRLGHTGDGVFRDFRRDNANTLRGYATLRFGWDDIANRQCTVAAVLAQALLDRGWPGRPQRCPLCAA
ncbi:MAG: type IV toxin-antitoxin system AbiEi family antitoxin domain-containing protein [Propionibacteriaceae bacterium]|nr:type IV toxin-antitoxin system AbiEi family antitoxin domain-containing protein [Propionibacteriaceae bacterium]